MDGYLKQDFIDQQSSTVIAYLRPGTNAMQLTSTNSQRSSTTNKIQIELIIRIEHITDQSEENTQHFKEKLMEQINEQCLVELKREFKLIFHTSAYSNIISEQTIKELVKLMP